MNKYKVKTGISLRFWKNIDRINKTDPYGWFQLYFRYLLDRRCSDDFRKLVSRFKGKPVKMIKDSGGEFNDYSISPKIRQIFLHWAYELTEKYFLPT